MKDDPPISIEALIGQLVEIRRTLGNVDVYYRAGDKFAGVSGRIAKAKMVGWKAVLCEDPES